LDGFAPLLWGWSVLLLLFIVDRLCSLHPQRLRSVLPLFLLAGGLWLSSTLVDLALRCQVEVNNWAPLQSFEHALRPHTS
jgi:hypothetical protein